MYEKEIQARILHYERVETVRESEGKNQDMNWFTIFLLIILFPAYVGIGASIILTLIGLYYYMTCPNDTPSDAPTHMPPLPNKFWGIGED